MAKMNVSYWRTGQVQGIQTGSKSLGALIVDNTNIPEDERGGTAKQLLASSVLFCFCGALGTALTARGAEYEKITGNATLETGLDEVKRARVTSIAIDVTVHMAEANEHIFERVEKIMQHGCLISASLEKAFPITYALHHEY